MDVSAAVTWDFFTGCTWRKVTRHYIRSLYSCTQNGEMQQPLKQNCSGCSWVPSLLSFAGDAVMFYRSLAHGQPIVLVHAFRMCTGG